MKKKDIIQLVKKLVKEDAYGSATLTTQGAPRTRAVAPAGKDPYTGRVEYPYTVGAKTKNGMMEDENLKEFTAMGQEGIYPKREEPGDMFQQKEVEDLMPNGMASRNDKAFQDGLKQHADWTEESGYNNTFVHIQYHEVFDREHSYRIHQSQNYNGNYKDFRNPKFTVLHIDKIKDGEEENLGKYIVDTDAYLKDFAKLRNDGVLGKQVSENKEIEVLDDVEGIENLTINISEEDEMAPEVMAPRIKYVFNKVNGTKHPVRTPEWHKNRFKDKYRIPFPEKLDKKITSKQALAMNRYATDMKNNLQEAAPLAALVARGAAAGVTRGATAGAARGAATRGATTRGAAGRSGAGSQYQKYSQTMDNINKAIDIADTVNSLIPDDNDDDAVYELKNKLMKPKKEATLIVKDKNDIPDKLNPEDKVIIDPMATMKEDNMEVDHEGRMAKSQMYKMQDYVKKLSMMLDDGAQLPGWVQSKLTKASDYMSSVFHYLEYEAVRGQDNLNEHVDKYKKRAVLMEGAMKKFFEMFDMGKTDEEIVQEYAQRGTQVPEMFVNKARKQYEGLKKMKLELEMSEKEYKNSATQIVNNPATNEMDGSTTMETKKLSTDLFNEDLDPVGQEDDDINNDGKVDKTDKYLKNKRKAVSKAINKQK